MRNAWCRGFILKLLFLAAGLTAFGQATQTELTGKIRDSSGAFIPVAAVQLIEVDTQQTRSTHTNSFGSYIFPHLKPGVYTIDVQVPGFKRFRREGVRVPVGERIRVDIELSVGNVEETITVNADAPLLRTESSGLGQVVSHRTVVNLPLKTRDFIGLVALSSGVALPPGSAFPRINGGRPRVNEYLYDGISVLQPEPGQAAFFPIVDAIQEFKVETSTPAAEFGRFSGGVVNLSTKSGSNEFHGSLFEFFRHEVLNARNLFAPRTSSNPDKPAFRRNQFGFVLGGPMVRGRTFFFTDYQGTRQRVGVVRISTVPTLLQRQGDFTEPVGSSVRLIYDPQTTEPSRSGFTRAQFAGNVIPSGRLDPVAQELLQRYPLPTAPGTANNFRRVDNEVQDQNQFDVRLDHRLSERDQVFGRFSRLGDHTIPITPLPDGSGNLTAGAIGPTRTTGASLAASHLHAFTPGLTSDLRFGYTRRSIARRSVQLGSPPSQSLGLPGIPANAAFQNALPTFLMAGFQQIGPPLNTNSAFRTDVTQVLETVSWQRGRHFLKTGWDMRFSRLDITQPPSPTGQFRFTSLFTDLPGVADTGFSLASFLLGQVQDFSIDLQQRNLRPRAWVQEFFLQDDWKAARKLTVNAGLRYTLNFPSTEVDNQGAVFNLATEQLEYLGQNGFPRAARKLHKLNFGPRLGLAYQALSNTVVRAGYGLIFIDQAGLTTPFTNPQFPFLQTVTQRTLDSIHPAFVLAGGPSVAQIPLTPDAGLGQGVFSADRQLGSGYAQHWNLSVQQVLAGDFSLELAYSGSKGTHIGIPDTNLNQLTAQQLATGPALLQQVANPFFGQLPPSSSLGGPAIPQAQLLKPFPRFTTVSLFRNNVGNTIYHGFRLKAEKRFAQGLWFLASYTRSKLMDEASSVFDASILTGPVANFPVADSFNRRLERDVSTGDIPNALVASWTYELPVGTGRRWNPAGIAGKFVGGWQVAGILTLQSGLPLAVTQATNLNAFAGFGAQRPNCLADPELPAGQRTTAQFFDVNAFQVAPQFTLGSCSRNPVRGPHYRNVDLAIIKNTPINERTGVEFRAEIFNVTNTPPLGSPNAVLSTAGFGAITSAGDPRVVQLAVKLRF